MRSVTFILLIMLNSPSYGLVSAQQQDPQPDKVTLEGFFLKGGMVNRVEGNVSYGKDGKPAQNLKANQAIEAGDVVNVDTNGRAEVLLNPGYYLRLSENTQAIFLDLSRENLKVRISSGSAILEVLEIDEPTTRLPTPQHTNPETLMNSTSKDDPAKPMSMPVTRSTAPISSMHFLPKSYQPVTFFTPQGDFAAMRGGIYRLDVGPNNTTELKVTKGQAVAAGKRVETGMSAILRNGDATLKEFKKGSEDVFDNWSRDRAALMVKYNKSLKTMGWVKTLRNGGLSYIKIDDEERNARERRSQVVSAMGGLVSFAEDGVSFKSENSEWKALTAGVGLNYGDAVKTGADSRTEIVVYPICYLHLAANTEIIYLSEPDGSAAVKLVRGSAIINYEPDNKSDPVVSFVAPGARYEILTGGVYRLNIGPSGSSEIIVHEGTVSVLGREIKVGKKAVFQNSELTVFPIDKKAVDTFDVWSRKRPVPSKRTNRVSYVRSGSYINSYMSGMWYFHPYVGTHTFVAGWWRIRSPYGGNYSVKFAGR